MNIAFFASTLSLLAGCQGNDMTASNSGDNYTIQGKLANATAGPIYLYEMGEAQFIARDTAQIAADGTFKFEGAVTEPTFYRIATDQQNGIMLVVDQGKIQLEADAKNLNSSATVEGSEDTKLFLELNKIVSDTRQQQAELEQKFSKAMLEGKVQEAEEARSAYLNLQNQVKDFLAKHPNSVVSAFGTASLIDPNNDFAFADSMATVFSKTLPSSKYTTMLQNRLEPFKSTAIGQTAPDIALPTPDGGTKKLSSLRGKYVLIDFWASWCTPCRKENPNVVRMYNAYKNKGAGFEIFGVSLDQSKDKWVQAIEKDGLTWPHVSDLQGWQSSAAQLYNVSAIPQTVLIDPQGKIVAKGLRGEDLEQKLASLLN